MLSSLLSFAALGQCPGSASTVHASCKTQVHAKANCKQVKLEMKSRVQGQDALWHDPHNKGHYQLELEQPDLLQFNRTTGNNMFTDKLTFTFQEGPDNTCTFYGCSESQVFSIGDGGTNYCNLFSLYCGQAEGCKFVTQDIAIAESKVSPSVGAGHDRSTCLKV